MPKGGSQETTYKQATLRSSCRRGVRYLALLGAIGLIYFGCAKAGLLLASINPSASPIWPATGLALAAVLLLGYRIFPAILMGAFLANATTAGSIATSSVIAVGNTVECLVGAWLIGRWSGGAGTFSSSTGVIRFALVCLSVATPISALIGAGTLTLAGYIDPSRFLPVWMTWWLGNAAGALVVTPVITLWAASNEFWLTTKRQWLEGIVAYGSAGVIGLVAFTPLVGQPATVRPLGFLAILPLTWTALRGSQRDTATVTLVLSCFAVWGTLQGGGPFADTNLNGSFLLLVMFMISTSVPSLVLSADVAMRKVIEVNLQRAHGVLDRQLHDQSTTLAETRQELNHAQKMEVLGQLTGGIAHDFNNLLTAVLGSLELVMKQVSDTRILRLLTMATHAAERGAALTAQMLAFARRREVATKPIDTNALILGMHDLLHRTIGPLLRINLDLQADLWPAVADPAQFEMALLNLAVNARDAMPLGGDLIVQTRGISGPPPAQVSDLATGNYVQISVGDTGSGMSKDVVAKAFDPFFTTKGPGKGSGLGLSMVYGFAKQVGGTATIDSVCGQGTIVHLYLPRAEVVPDEPSAASVGVPPAGNLRILVVDDDDTVRGLTTEMLQEMGHDVADAASGRSALELLREGRDCDLLLVDFAMPLMNGSECASEARKLRPDLAILFMTGYVDSEVLKRWSELGFRTLNKPFQYAQLATAIHQARRPPPEASNIFPLRAP